MKTLLGYLAQCEQLIDAEWQAGLPAGEGARLKEQLSKKLSALFEQAWQEKEQKAAKLKEKIARQDQEISQLKKANETLVSNNYLLEYKKKDLMLLADQLEEAYEEISRKNAALEEQKQKISEQAQKLQEAHQEILVKNSELQQQKEAIQDQADYLHEANLTISHMHAEVEKQKDEILKKNKKLLSLNEEKNNLIGIVAHDLKSPLNQIQGLIDIVRLTDQQLSPDSRSCLEIMEKSTGRLNEMIAKILDVKAIEAQSLNLKMETINLSQLATECAARYALTARDKNIRLRQQIASDKQVLADSGFVVQVFDNLLSNALKFSQPETEVGLYLEERQGEVVLEVRDQGPGLTEEDMKKLFGRFQKLSARPTANETSTGLGLSIVKQFVEAMQGRIWCESKAGKGASFFVAFKLVTKPKQLVREAC